MVNDEISFGFNSLDDFSFMARIGIELVKNEIVILAGKISGWAIADSVKSAKMPDIHEGMILVKFFIKWPAWFRVFVLKEQNSNWVSNAFFEFYHFHSHADPLSKCLELIKRIPWWSWGTVWIFNWSNDSNVSRSDWTIGRAIIFSSDERSCSSSKSIDCNSSRKYNHDGTWDDINHWYINLFLDRPLKLDWSQQ